MKYKKLTLSLIIMMILSLGGVAATLTYAKLSSSNTTQTMSGGTPPSMPGNSQSNSSSNTTQNQTNSSSNTTQNQTDSSSNTTQNQSNSSGNTTQNQTDSSNKNMMISSTQSSGLGSMQVLIIGECLFVFSASSLVLIATKAGKKSIKEALNKSYKVVIVVISTVLLTGTLTYGTVMCANTYLLDSKQVQLQGSGTPPTLPSQSQ
ncbi:hypothetical protein SAMN04487759_11070 [Kandleria vitulina]|uniref:Uncharacterized protein n=1 Tax=Kandleria vitulina TaxID=1630 RepID=A0A1H2STY7_9FIRM|nr:hypothetical protein [Kandleria vitulina]SDW34494.1 hypothetical protein SAMN04487759_11070 [Kandleria vitulina]